MSNALNAIGNSVTVKRSCVGIAVDGLHISAVKNTVNNSEVGVLGIYFEFLEVRSSRAGREGTEYCSLVTGGVDVVQHIGSEGLVKGKNLNIACSGEEVVGNVLSILGEYEGRKAGAVLEDVRAVEGLKLLSVGEINGNERGAKTEGLSADGLDLTALSKGNSLKSGGVVEGVAGLNNACGNYKALDLGAVEAVSSKHGKSRFFTKDNLEGKRIKLAYYGFIVDLFGGSKAGRVERTCKRACSNLLNAGEVILNYSRGVKCVGCNTDIVSVSGNVKLKNVAISATGGADSVFAKGRNVRGKIDHGNGVIVNIYVHHSERTLLLMSGVVTADSSVGLVGDRGCEIASTDLEKLLVVLRIVVIVLLEGYGLDLLHIVKRTVFNKSYGLGNGKSCNALNIHTLIERRTVKKGYRHIESYLVKHARDVHVLAATGGNGDVSKCGTALEYLRNAGNLDVGAGGACSYIGAESSKSCGEVDRGKLSCVLKRIVVNGKRCGSLLEAYGGKLGVRRSINSKRAGTNGSNVCGDRDSFKLGILECVGADLGYVRAKSDRGKSGAGEHVVTDVGSSVLKVDGRELGAAEEYALGAGVNDGELSSIFAVIYINGRKLGAVRECTCADGGNLSGNADSGEFIVILERIVADSGKCGGHSEACKVSIEECRLTDNGSVIGNRCVSKSLAVCERVLRDNESSTCLCTCLIGKSGKSVTVGECRLTDPGYALLDLKGCKRLVTGECCVTDSGDGCPRKRVESCLVNRKSSGVVDKSGVALVVKNSESIGYENGVICINLDLGKSRTAVKYGTVECGNGGGEIYGGDLRAVSKRRITECDITVASLGEVNSLQLGVVVERLGADAGNRCGNCDGSNSGALESTVANLNYVNIACKVNASELSLVLKALAADLGDLNALTEGNGLDVSYAGCGCECLGADGDSTVIKKSIGAVAADNDGLKCVTACECACTDGEIDESVTLDGNSLYILTAVERVSAYRLNIHGDGDGGKSDTVVECACTDVEDTAGNGKVTGYREGSVKDSILIAVGEHAVNGGVNNAARLYLDGSKLGKLVKNIGVVELSKLCGEGDLGDAGGSIEDAVGLAGLAAHKHNIGLSVTLELNLGKSLTGVERSLIDSGYVLGDDDLVDVGVLEYLVTNGGNSLGSLEGTGLSSGEHLKSYTTHIVTDKSSVIGSVEHLVVAVNVVNVDSLKAGASNECTGAYELDGVGDVDGNEKLVALESILKDAGYALIVVGYGNSDVRNLIEVSACGNRIGIVILKLVRKNVVDEDGVNGGVLGELRSTDGVTVLVGKLGTGGKLGREPAREHGILIVDGGNGESKALVIGNVSGITGVDVGDAEALYAQVKGVGKRSPSAVNNKVLGSGEYLIILVLGAVLGSGVPACELIAYVAVIAGRQSHCIAGCKILYRLTALKRTGVVGYLVRLNGELHPIGALAVCVSDLNKVVTLFGKSDLSHVGAGYSYGIGAVYLNLVIGRADNVGPGYGILCIGNLERLGEIACIYSRAELRASVSLYSRNGNGVGGVSRERNSRKIKGSGIYGVGVVIYLYYIARSTLNRSPGKHRTVKSKVGGNRNDFGLGGAGGRDYLGRDNLVTLLTYFVLFTVLGLGSVLNNYPLGLGMSTRIVVTGCKCHHASNHKTQASQQNDEFLRLFHLNEPP